MDFTCRIIGVKQLVIHAMKLSIPIVKKDVKQRKQIGSLHIGPWI